MLLGNFSGIVGNTVGNAVSPLVADYVKELFPSVGVDNSICSIQLEDLVSFVEKRERKLMSLKNEVLDSGWLDWAIPVGAFIFSFFVVYDFCSKRNKRKGVSDG
jgi:hypothetical protein